MPAILYVDNPSSETREDLAQKMRAGLAAVVNLVGSIEEFSEQVQERSYDLYVCGDSMLFKGRIVQGWEPLHRWLAKHRNEDTTKFVVLSNRESVVQDARLYQLMAFLKNKEFEKFLGYARSYFQAT